MKCPQCNTNISESMEFCPVCGMAQEVKKCKNCSAPLYEGAKFCARCGAEQAEQLNCARCQAPLLENSSFCIACGASVDAPKNPLEEESAVKTLVFGILGAAFALTGYLSILGIIFSAISRKNLKAYLGYTDGKIKDARAGVGNGLSIGGLIAGIISTVAFVVIIILVITGLANNEMGWLGEWLYNYDLTEAMFWLR